MKTSMLFASALALTLSYGSLAVNAAPLPTIAIQNSAVDGFGSGGAVTFGAGYGAFLPDGASAGGTPPKAAVGDAANQHDTPFGGGNVGQSYWVTGPTYAPSSTWLNFADGANALQMIWGSVDVYNSIQFYADVDAGGGLVAEITGTDLMAAFNPALLPDDNNNFGYVFEVLLGVDRGFKSVVFNSSQAALEMAFVPIPPAALLFGTALAGVGFMSRRKKAQAAA